MSQLFGLTAAQWDLITTVTNLLLSGGLLWFARQQWKVTDRQAVLQESAEATRRIERLEEAEAQRALEARALDREFQVAWAEHFRLEGLADLFAKEDLVGLAALGALNPEDVLPRDWTVVMTALARLGVEAGYLGAVALSLGQETARSITLLKSVVDGFRTQYPGRSPSELVDLVRHNRAAETTKLQAQIRKMTDDLARVMWDAIRHSPRADAMREMHFHDDLASDAARAAVKAVATRGSSLSLPLTSAEAAAPQPRAAKPLSGDDHPPR